MRSCFRIFGHGVSTRAWRVSVAGALSAVLMTGCAPPSPQIGGQGHPLVRIEKKTLPPFKTVEIDGAELRESRYPAGKFGGNFHTVSIGRGPKTFNPVASTDATSSEMAGLMLTGLVETDPHTGEIMPSLAKSIDIKPDGRTYIAHLRKGLQWSDGKPLTANDVVFTYNDVIKPGFGNPSGRDNMMVENQFPVVKKLDDLTIEFVTAVPFAPFKGMMGSNILPEHVFGPVVRKHPKDFDAFWGVNTPAGNFVANGPFILERYISGQRAIFKRNPYYYMVDMEGRRLPYVSHYVVDFVQDANAELLQFQQGGADVLDVPGQQIYYVKTLPTPKFKLYDLGPNTGTTFLVFNQNPRRSKETGRPYVNAVHSEWFRDVNFRKAVDYAIDREGIVENILRGVGAPLFTAESLASVFLNPKLAHGHPRNLDKARQYLRASGFHWNKAGELYDRHGHRVTFELLTNSGNLERESVGIAIKQDLADIGIAVDYRALDFNVLVGKMDNSGWETMVMGLTGSTNEPHGGKNVWNSQGALHMFNQRKADRDVAGTDRVEPWEAEIDHAFEKGATTLNMANRKEIYNQYQQIAYDWLPFIYLYSPKRLSAVRDRVHNLDPTPVGGIIHNIESLWLSSRE